jgi:hypothetical protein
MPGWPEQSQYYRGATFGRRLREAADKIAAGKDIAASKANFLKDWSIHLVFKNLTLLIQTLIANYTTEPVIDISVFKFTYISKSFQCLCDRSDSR